MSSTDSREQARAIQELLRQQRWTEALPLLEEWTCRSPNHTGGWLWRAGCLARLGRLEEALASAQTARALAPTEPKATDLVRRLEARLAGVTMPVAAPAPVARPAGAAAPVKSGAAGTEPEGTLAEETSPAPVTPERTLVDSGTGAESPETTLVESSAAPAEPRDATLREASKPEPPGPPATLAEPDRSAGTPGARPAEHWEVGQVVEGRYEVRGSARGGMGEVSFVHDRELGLDLAVKTPLPAALATAAGRARFLREAEAWIALGLHPNVCTAYHVRELGGLPRLFIEYLDGGTLEEWLRARPEASLAERLDLAIQVAAGMEHAHTCAWEDEEGQQHHGLVHRDLKPANVLLGRDGTARVTDFGLVGRGTGEAAEAAAPTPARITLRVEAEPEATLVEGGPVPTRTGTVWATVTLGGRALGSPPYMAPEQWAGAHLAGPTADVYAFGCILYELVCRRRAFALDPKYLHADPEVQRRTWEHLHRTQPPPDPRSLLAGLDDRLAELMLACLSKEAARRPVSFADLGRSLREAYARVAGRPYPRAAPRPAELRADSLCNRGVSFAALGHLERAERAWREALAADPQHLAASFNLGLLEWRHRGATDQDLVNRVEAVRVGDDARWLQQLLAGRVYLCLGRHHEALDRLRAAAASTGKPEVVRELILALCAAAGSGDGAELWREAQETIEHAGDWAATDGVMLTCAALAAARLGNSERSESLWAEARRRLDDLPEELERSAQRLLPGAQLVRRLAAPGTRAVAVDVSRDGRLGLAGGDIGRIGVWDLERGELVRNPRGREERVRCVAVVSAHGLGLSATGNDAVAVWDLTSGAVRRTLQVHTGYLNALVASADGRVAAAVGSAGTLLVWDLTSGKRRAALKAHEVFATALALADDASLAVTGGGDGTVRVFDLAAGRCVTSFDAHSGAVTALALSANRRRALSGGEDGLARLWDLGAGTCLATLTGHVGAVRCVALAGDRALTGGADGTLRLWDLATTSLVKVEQVEGGVDSGAASPGWSAVLVAHGGNLSQLDLGETPHYRPAWAVAHPVTASAAGELSDRFRSLLEEGRRSAAARDYRTAFVKITAARRVSGYERSREAIELEARLAALFPRGNLRGAWEDRALRGHDGPLTAAALSPRGHRAVSAGRDQRLVLWDLRSGASLGAVVCPATATAVAALKEGRIAAAAHLDSVVRLWDVERGQSVMTLHGHEGRIHSLAVDPLARCLLTASADGSARVWDPASGVCHQVLSGHLGQVLAAAVAPDSRLGLTGGDDGSLLLWDLPTGRVASELRGHTAAVLGLAWSTEGRYALSTSRDGSVRLWDVRAARCLRTLGEGLAGPATVAFSPDSRWALVGEESGRLGLWDLRERRCARTLDGHTAAVVAAAFDRSGRGALSASEDGSLRVWYLDWEPRERPFAEWDEAARPHLEVFLAQHAPRRGGGRPEWTEEEARELIADLGHRGLGWLRPDGVRTHLAEMAESWQEAPPPATRAEPGRSPVRASSPVERQQRSRRLRRLAVAAVVLAPLLFAGAKYLAWSALHFNARELEGRRERNLTILVLPEQLARPTECDPAKLDDYLREFAEPSDSPKAWSAAGYCLVALHDPRVVAPLLDTLRPRAEPTVTPRTEEEVQVGSDPRKVMQSLRRAMLGGLEPRLAVLSILARLAELGVPELTRFLADPDPTVRKTAAGALALVASPHAIAALVENAGSENPAARLSVAEQLPNIACSGQLDLEATFTLAEQLTADPDPGVRLATAKGLRIFLGSRPRALARQLAEDPDAKVREAVQ